eukprot:TRINITY_DN58876_c0_g1_i1.p2 TRINITY_DN58876_c0_g1~~TRINITY_DN58876_c0_g1_i1.p2  ORF type:complete len:101 (-),score=19.77 TRINITY_DN58876_c0_g1_i1:142-444(-)
MLMVAAGNKNANFLKRLLEKVTPQDAQELLLQNHAMWDVFGPEDPVVVDTLLRHANEQTCDTLLKSMEDRKKADELRKRHAQIHGQEEQGAQRTNGSTNR